MIGNVYIGQSDMKRNSKWARYYRLPTRDSLLKYVCKGPSTEQLDDSRILESVGGPGQPKRNLCCL